MSQRISDGTTRGASSVGGDRKRRAGWLPWLVLGALALLGLLAFLLLRNAGDDGDDQGIDTTNDAAAETDAGSGTDDGTGTAGGTDDGSGDDATATTAAPSTTADAGTGSGTDDGSGSGGGILTAGGQDVFSAAGSGGLASLSAQPVEGQGVTVESVVADEGFWVGTAAQRVFVFLTPEARTSEGESPFQVEAGQRIDVTGTLQPVPADIAPFGVEAEEGADELIGQGQYVEATAIELNG